MGRMKSGGTLMVVINSLLNAVQSASDVASVKKIHGWHTCALHWKQEIVAIFDPNFEGIYERLHKYGELILVKSLINTMQVKRRSIKEIWIGGGGGRGNECQEMTRAWFESEV